MRFANKYALVTGGGSGIGRAVCLAFAREGADVGVADVSLEGAEATAQEVRKSGRKAVALRVDVTDPASVQAMVNQAVVALGRVDLLVNSAGVREIVPFLQLSFAEWQRVIATNLTGTFLCGQAVAQYLVAQGRGGKIVNLASVAGLMAVPNRAAYVSSKHAVVGLTKEMAMEVADKNIQVNAVAPGVVRTSMTESYFDKPEIVEGLKRAHPAGRWAQPEEIANLILFLASSE
ncbi:MAG TPA: SDR family NAD(P)-dependent oxidoreductase, partial [Candidatus Binatia bacterium]|nr:SDR family NAD(P)-dependent oxidoreductase [Candidatus Binatia bacterium]